jgi:hypothetical protein
MKKLVKPVNSEKLYLYDCNPGLAGMWGVATILTSATPFGWFCAGMGVAYLIDC